LFYLPSHPHTRQESAQSIHVFVLFTLYHTPAQFIHCFRIVLLTPQHTFTLHPLFWHCFTSPPGKNLLPMDNNVFDSGASSSDPFVRASLMYGGDDNNNNNKGKHAKQKEDVVSGGATYNKTKKRTNKETTNNKQQTN
jgi:hypothetical protein